MEEIKKMITDKIQSCDKPDLLYLIYCIIDNLPF